MNTHTRFILALVFSVPAVTGAFAADAGHDHMDGMHHDNMSTSTSAASTGDQAAWLAAATGAYPLNTCVVSGDELGADMGKPIDYVYKVEGQPDRLVLFCCTDCVRDFNKDPAKYLAKIDEAAAKKAAEGKGRRHLECPFGAQSLMPWI